MAESPIHALLRRAWWRVQATPAQGLAWRVRILGRSARRAVAGGLVSAAERLGAEPAHSRADAWRDGSSWGGLAGTYVSVPPPRQLPGTWPAPPAIDAAAAIVRAVQPPAEPPARMDLALLEALNEEYRSKPLVPEPADLDQSGRENRASRRLLETHHQIDLAEKRVLELGCGPGFEVWYLSHHFGSEAWGVDIVERRAWATLADDRTRFVAADLAHEQPFEPDMFDRIISFSVLEHVVHPAAVIRELHRVLRPGGLAAIMANLHRGPKASHLYRELFFPFPHLLFGDDVIRQFREKHHGISFGAAWVNRLTWSQYENLFRDAGFSIRALRFSETPIDEAFYERFSDVLSRYPRWDLTKDFFHVVVEKPAATPRASRR